MMFLELIILVVVVLLVAIAIRAPKKDNQE